jgi:hypothetical protein
MSSDSPRDLAVTFRSIPRRLREAQGDAPHESTSTATSELHGLMGEAGRLLGTNEDPMALADAIEAVPADAWDDAVLDRLRQIALDLGRLLRHISQVAESGN